MKIVTLAVCIGLAACSAPATQNTSGISIGPEVNVSADRSRIEHVEVVADGDPVHEGRLIACSMFQSRPVETVRTAAYISTDNGKTWTTGAVGPEGSWDTDCHATQDGTMYFSSDIGQNSAWMKMSPKMRDKATGVELFKGSGNGKLAGPVDFAKGNAEDREWSAIDDYPSSRYHDRIYVWYAHGFDSAGYKSGKGMHFGNQLIVSKDGGKTFGSPVNFGFQGGDEIGARGIVTPDGTFVTMFGIPNPQGPEATIASHSQDLDRSQHQPTGVLYAVVSRDGGSTVDKPIKIADVGANQAENIRVISTIAVDRSSAQFKGRIYAAWADTRPGRSVIMVAHSDDDAKTWSTPTLVDDDFWNKDNEKGPDDFMATVGVNPKGVVGMMWYDRRDDPNDQSYHVRFSASRDGGETWSPSVAIPGAYSSYETTDYPDFYPAITDASKKSDIATIDLANGTWIIGGHTAGMAVSADGTFHPVWVDYRTRVQQLWTASISVDGPVVRNGDVRLAPLADITKQVHVEIQHPVYDRPSGTISVETRLQNTGSKALKGPVYLRAIGWTSDIALATATNADNQQTSPGAVWKFGAANSVIAPHASTPWRTITFHVSDVQSLHRDGQYYTTFLSLNARVLGKT